MSKRFVAQLWQHQEAIERLLDGDYPEGAGPAPGYRFMCLGEGESGVFVRFWTVGTELSKCWPTRATIGQIEAAIRQEVNAIHQLVRSMPVLTGEFRDSAHQAACYYNARWKEWARVDQNFFELWQALNVVEFHTRSN